MWTLKSLSSVPSKTVRPTPTMPGRTSLMGISEVAAGKETVSRPASRPPQRMTAAWIRNFMCLQGKGDALSSYKEQLVAGQGERCYRSLLGMTLFSSARRNLGTKASYWWWYACAEGAIR